MESTNLYLYYILLENNKYYLTCYNQPNKTIQDILLIYSYNCPDWLLINRPIKILKIIYKNPNYSMKDYIICFIRKKGINNVRGNMIPSLILSNETLIYINNTIARIKVDYYEECEFDEDENYNNDDGDDNYNNDSENNINNNKSRFNIVYNFINWLCYKKKNKPDNTKTKLLK